ncbi:MAG: hypothetical protein J0L96_07140 [Anaerolineae bacterium]|nr:hypothetical protein [Anaerolineae bacterium]
MVVIRLFAFFSIIAILVGVIAYGVALSRKAKSESDKIFISRFFIILIITFAAGGITRTIQQNTENEWLNGFVPIFGGLFISLWGIPFFWRVGKDNIKGVKSFLFLVPGLLFVLLGLGIIYIGITQVWKVLL